MKTQKVLIEDRVPEPATPRAKAVRIGEVAEGEITPRIYSDRLVWDANISPKRHASIGHWLLQGHGPDPRAAVGDAILRARRENTARIESLSKIEEVCGTSGLSDEQLEATIRNGAS